jgi:hypothetical protein
LPVYGVGVVLVIGVLLGIYQAAVIVALPPDKRNRWDLYNLLRDWPWGWYATLVAAIVVLVILEGSYRRWKGEHDAVSAFQRRLEPGMALSFSEANHGVEVEEGRPLRQIASVTVSNTGGVQLKDCQVMIRLASTEGGFSWRHKFPVCAPFYLRIGEEESVGLLSIDFDDPQSPIRLTHFMQVDGFWREFPTPVTIPSVDFDAIVECISADSQPARLCIEFRRLADRWSIGAETDR